MNILLINMPIRVQARPNVVPTGVGILSSKLLMAMVKQFIIARRINMHYFNPHERTITRARAAKNRGWPIAASA
jgi:hypothetical protein